MKSLVSLLVALAAMWWLAFQSVHAADQPTDTAGELKAELLSLRVERPQPGGKLAVSHAYPGTSLAFWITDRGGNHLISFDSKGSKLESFTDDKGTDLSQRMPGPYNWSVFGAFRGGFSSEDGYPVEVGGDSFPAPGATKVSLKATLFFRRGSSEKTIEEKDVPVKTGRKIKLGALEVRIEAMNKKDLKEPPQAKMGIWLRSSQSLESMKSVSFFNPKGDEIPIGVSSYGSRDLPPRGPDENGYWFHEKHDTVTIKITYYEKVETVTMPLRMETGVGF